MVTLYLKALFAGLLAPVFWWLALWASGYPTDWIYRIVHSVGFPGYMFYIYRFVLVAKGVLFAVILVGVLKKWFASAPKASFVLFMIGYAVGLIVSALIASRVGVRVRLDSLFDLSWVVFFSISLIAVLVQIPAKKRDAVQPIIPPDAAR